MKIKEILSLNFSGFQYMTKDLNEAKKHDASLYFVKLFDQESFQKNEKEEAYKSEAMSKKEKRMIYVVPDTCFVSSIAQEDNPMEGNSSVIYRSDVVRLLEKVHEHNSVYNQVTATFMIPAPLLGEVFSNVNTMNELEYIINGTPYKPISNQQENPIRLTNEKKRRVFDVGVRTKKIGNLVCLTQHIVSSISASTIDVFREFIMARAGFFLTPDVSCVELNEKNIFSLAEYDSNSSPNHKIRTKNFIDYQARLCIQTIKNEYGEPIVLTDDKDFFMKCRDLRVLSLCSPIAKKLADESQEETENRDSSSDLAEINGEIKSIDSFLALFVDSDAAFLPVVQQQAAVSFRLNKPKGNKKKNQTLVEESQDEFEVYYEEINQRIAQGGLKSNNEGKNILIPVPLLLATTKENWALFRDKMTELGHQVTVVPYSAKEAIAMGYLSQRLKQMGISYGDVHNNEHKYYLQILATIIMNSQGTPGGGDEKSFWFIPKWLVSDKFLKFSKDLGIDLSKYNLMAMLTKENGMPRVIGKPPRYRYNMSRDRE